jgi:hypothetical protein
MKYIFDKYKNRFNMVNKVIFIYKKKLYFVSLFLPMK